MIFLLRVSQGGGRRNIVPVCHRELSWSGRTHQRICMCDDATFLLSGVWTCVDNVYNVYNVYGALWPFTADLMQQEPLH